MKRDRSEDKHRHNEEQKPHEKVPPEGPHGRKGLQDEEKTPGSGALPDLDRQVDVGPD